MKSNYQIAHRVHRAAEYASWQPAAAITPWIQLILGSPKNRLEQTHMRSRAVQTARCPRVEIVQTRVEIVQTPCGL